MNKQSKWKKIIITANIISVAAIISIIFLQNTNKTIADEPEKVKNEIVIPEESEEKTASKVNIDKYKYPARKDKASDTMLLTDSETDQEEVETTEDDEENRTVAESFNSKNDEINEPVKETATTNKTTVPKTEQSTSTQPKSKQDMNEPAEPTDNQESGGTDSEDTNTEPKQTQPKPEPETEPTKPKEETDVVPEEEAIVEPTPPAPPVAPEEPEEPEEPTTTVKDQPKG